MSPAPWRQQEESLVQHLPKLYQAHLGHCPERITCEIARDQVAIALEGALTQPEKLLRAHQHATLVQNLRTSLDQVLRRKMATWIAEQLQVEVVEMFVNTDVMQDRMMAIAILRTPPHCPQTCCL